MPRLVLRFILCAAALAIPLTGARADWLVVMLSGAATSWSAENRQHLARGQLLPDNVTVSTAGRGRIVLKRGASTVVVGPSTSMTFSGDSDGGTIVRQHSGRAEYEVERRKVRYFTVDTPFLAAVVKGTRFTVTVGRRDAAVAVTRGLVGVTAFGSGDSADIPFGQRATTRKGHLVITGRGPKPVILHGDSRRSSLIPASTAAVGTQTPTGSGSGIPDDKGHVGDANPGKTSGEGGSGDTGGNGTADTGSKGTADTGSKGTADTGSKGTADTGSKGTADTGSKGTADTGSKGTGDAGKGPSGSGDRESRTGALDDSGVLRTASLAGGASSVEIVKLAERPGSADTVLIPRRVWGGHG